MNLLEPHRNPVLLGHDTACEEIKATFTAGRMPQAWLITGIDGIGKATLAFHIANFVLSDGQNTMGRLNAEHPTSRLIAAESHPDLFVLQRPIDEKTGDRKDSIPTEEARKIAPFLHRTATQGHWRVAIIDEAQALNRFGQNAILKVIEEPPARCLILITATTPGILLPTIRSRCRSLPLEPLAPNIMRAVLARLDCDTGNDNETLSEVVNLSGGSVGFAIRLLESETLPLYNEMQEIIQVLPELDMPRLHALADGMGRKGNAEAFAVLSKLLVDDLQNKAKQRALTSTKGAQLDRSLQTWEKVREIFATANYANLDRKLAFINAITEIRRSFM